MPEREMRVVMQPGASAKDESYTIIILNSQTFTGRTIPNKRIEKRCYDAKPVDLVFLFTGR